MLFSGLQGQAQRRIALGVLRDPDQATWHLAFLAIACSQESGMRTAVTNRHTESLSRSDRNVGSEFTGWPEYRQSEEIAGDDRESARFLDLTQ